MRADLIGLKWFSVEQALLWLRDEVGVELSENDLLAQCDAGRCAVLRLRFNTQTLTNYDEMLARFRREGFAAAKQFSGDQAVEPSIASTMLARDFQS